MSLPKREMTQEERIAARRMAVLATPELRLMYDAARLLDEASRRFGEQGDVEMAVKCTAVRLHIDKHLGLLWNWREDIRMEPPEDRGQNDDD